MADTLAVNGGTPVRTQPWPKWPVHDERDERALLEALRSGVWGIGGKRVGEFECEFAGLHKAKYGVCCCNGTVALQIALVAAGVKPGDEVITSPYTFMASALAIAAVGAVPVFIDVAEGTHNLDPKLIEAAVSPRTTAIMPVHIGGRPCDMDGIMEIAQRRGLKVIEDAAQAWMAEWRGTPVGTIGEAGTFSFQSSKNLNSGEGGIILTNDDGVFQRAWSYHNCGRTLGGAWYQHDYPGFNYRLGELQAALLKTQLSRLPEQQARRRAAMAALDAGLAGIPGLRIADPDPRVTAHAAHIYMVRLDPAAFGPTAKPAFLKALQAEGIPAGPGYTTPLYQQKFWQWFDERPTGGGGTYGATVRLKFDAYDLPVCQKLCDTTIWVKQDVLLAGEAEMKDVVAAFAKVADAARAGRLA
jgi:dTDP-4-amino-4,6-dideoxygalactose transaminase